MIQTDDIGKRVKALADILPQRNPYGNLTNITKGRYRYIIKFDNGSEFGVSEARLANQPIDKLEKIYYDYTALEDRNKYYGFHDYLEKTNGPDWKEKILKFCGFEDRADFEQNFTYLIENQI